MREEILKRFFQGEITGTDLAKDVAGSAKEVTDLESIPNLDIPGSKVGKYVSVEIEDMEEEFVVTRSMLLSLCDAVLSASLPTDALATIGFALEASDKFGWDADVDELVANVIADWSCPEVNYPLTIENMKRFRAWLTGAEPYPSKPTGMATREGRTVSVTEKKRINA